MTEPVTLTHDVVRKDGVWRCVSCGRTGWTIRDVNEHPCPKQATDNSNVLSAIDGTLAAQVSRKENEGT